MPPTLQMCRQLGEINLASEQTMTLQMCKQLGETSLTNFASVCVGAARLRVSGCAGSANVCEAV